MASKWSNSYKLHLYVASAALIVGAGLAATPTTSFAADATAATAAAAAPTDTTVTDVVVTATRREEVLSRVPVAVTAATGTQLLAAHIVALSDLPTLATGISFNAAKGSSTSAVTIRGQTEGDDSTGLEVPVAIFIDDIYYGTLADFDGNFFDIGQIAVLKGPQGTTFGRNVVGGALQITTNKPQLGVTNGEIDLTAETYDSGAANSPGVVAQGDFNVAIGQDAAFRLAYIGNDVGGYMHNFLTGHNLSNNQSVGVRPSFVWEPSDKLKISAFADYEHENDYSSGYRAFGQGSVVAGDNAISNSPWASFENTDGNNLRNSFAAQIRGDLQESYGTLTAISSYRYLNAKYIDDGDSGPLLENNNSQNLSKEYEYSEELRLTSPSGQKLEYVVGLYYSYENLFKGITLGFNGAILSQYLSVLTHGMLDNQIVQQDDHTQSIAPYGEAKYHFTDQLALTVGARYTVESKNGYTQHIGDTTPFYGAAYLVNWSHSWSAFTPRVIAEYTPTHSLLFYGSVSTGFQGGGYSYTPATAAAAIIPLKPETTTSYEVGAKVHLFDNRLSINADGYWADTKNLQVRSLQGATYTLTNAALETVRGFELESSFIPFHNAQIGLNYAYTDAFYASFPGCTSGGANCTRNYVPGNAPNDVKLLLDYRWDLGESGSLAAHLDDEWASKVQVNILNSADQVGGLHSGKGGILNGSLTYAPVNARWKLELWGKNLTNQWVEDGGNYYFYFLTVAEFTAGNRFVERGTVAPPRQFGATLSFKF